MSHLVTKIMKNVKKKQITTVILGIVNNIFSQSCESCNYSIIFQSPKN